MIESSESIIRIVSVHRVGNGSLNEELKLSEGPLEIEDDKLHQLLQTFIGKVFEKSCLLLEEIACVHGRFKCSWRASLLPASCLRFQERRESFTGNLSGNERRLEVSENTNHCQK